MHHIERYEEEVFIEDARVTRLIYGIWKGNKVPIYLEDDDDNHFIKNCDCVFMNGWMMSVPGETCRSYGYTYTVQDEEWYKIDKSLDWSEWENRAKLIEKMGELAIELYPSFKYVLKKWKPKTTSALMKALILWKEYPEIEFMLAMGFEEIAFSTAFYRLSDSKKKAYCKWMRNNPNCTDICFKKLQTIVCHNLTVQEWNDYQAFVNKVHNLICISYQIYKYLASQIAKLPNNWTPREIADEWEDYKVMAKRAGHDLKEAYWKFPSNLVKAHDKVMAEVARIEEAERIAKEKAAAEEERQNRKRLKAIAKKFKDIPEQIDGYSIFISTDYDEWKRQAEALHQCICSGGYFQKVLKGECTIIFIQKDGKPEATAQIMSNGKLNQFYADERSGTPGGSIPSTEIKEAFNKWLELVPKSKFKKRRNSKKEAA